MILASIASFLGSLWFALLCGVCGYVLGMFLPLKRKK